MPLNTAFPLDQPYAAPADLGKRQTSIARAVLALVSAPGVQRAHQVGIATIALWKWTEAAGMSPNPKYNLRFVSEGALQRDAAAKVQHEHVWTRKWILDRLLGRTDWELNALQGELDAFGVACVVTEAEHALLGRARGQGWARYRSAEVRVWDRQDGCWMDIDNGEPASHDLPEPAPDVYAPVDEAPGGELVDVTSAIDLHAGPRAELLRRLFRTISFAGSVGVVQQPNDPAKRPDYVRIHDTVVEEPTSAVAYVHWNGRVSLALQLDEVPDALRDLPFVTPQAHRRYGVACRVTDTSSMEAGESLVALALDRLRLRWEQAIGG